MRSAITLSICLTCVILFALAHGPAFGQGAPDSLSFQGYLTDSVGDPMDSSGVDITFNLYKGGSSVWMETQSVDVSNGVFHVYLGAVEPLDTVAFNQPIDLGIKVGADPEISPRTPLAASAFALGLRGLYVVAATNGAGTSSAPNLIGGADNNYVADNVLGATIGGGGGISTGTPVPDSVTANWGTVGGGLNNRAGGRATVGGGAENTASGGDATVGGGWLNVASSLRSTIGGGRNNTASDIYTTVSGGWINAASGSSATVGGGSTNTASGNTSTVGGGTQNTASGISATIAGGSQNTADGTTGAVGGGLRNTASGNRATVGGGDRNTASGNRATVPGGRGNTAGGFTSFAAGYLAGAKHDGTFVWQDSTGTTADTLSSTASNQFLARASGGFFLYTGAAPNLTSGISLPAGSGTWTALSSASSKTNFRDVDPRSYLDRVASLDLKEWSYKTEKGVTHVGPMAEDFYATFGLGPTDKGISGVDGDGVAIAAIQGLYDLVKEQQALIDGQQAEIERLRQLVEGEQRR